MRDCKRPRPLVLRANVDDTLIIRVTNWLAQPESPDFSRDFCPPQSTQDSNAEAVRPDLSVGSASLERHGEVLCTTDGSPGNASAASTLTDAPNWPNTRGVNLLIQGLTPLPIDGAINDACIGAGYAAPGAENSFLCKYRLEREGTYFFASQAAPAGGEGEGGSIVHGLFGALMVEREGARAYRSQTSAKTFDAVWPRAENGRRHARTQIIDYEKTQFEYLQDQGDDAPQPADANDPLQRTPLLNMAMVLDQPDGGGMPVQDEFAGAKRLEIVHSDLNAIIYCDPAIEGDDCRQDQAPAPATTSEPIYSAFREFSVFFHDELKTFYTKNFEELGKLGQLAGVKDGFAINYGASGMGSLLLANRKGMGPASECKECLYEEFFLTSWANGDPALLEWYADDPSNVHHSYLNDPVVFRNFHAGPKETHVFHLHAHQWFAGNDPSRGSYLDSQTVAPQQGFTYNIYHGGMNNLNGAPKGWWDTQGSGNRNRTIGDSIFHCHLYPHFAQGMWALWRVHDVLEDGTRKMPDGQVDPGLSTEFPEAADRGHSRPGTVERLTGRWIGPTNGADPDESYGTPIPALIPLPGEPLPLLPTYASEDDVDTSGPVPRLADEAKTPMPGFPFYIAGQPGHRPPQAPLDIARKLAPTDPSDEDGIVDLDAGQTILTEVDTRSIADGWLDGGLGRHVVTDGSDRELGFYLPDAVANMLEPDEFDTLDQAERGMLTSQVVAKAFALGDLSGHLTRANIETLPNDGTRLERGAMGFHYNGLLYRADGLNDQLALSNANGTDLTVPASGAGFGGNYPTSHAELPNGDDPQDTSRGIYVNGSPPKPGAPFADPCGTSPAGRESANAGIDPLYLADQNFWRDPLLIGYRRYEVSAVQLDMVVNRAGWHDPQARINVRTSESERFKDRVLTTGPKPISPTVSDTEEPFFFRALSGECIEFRHTNELPKELELDDFQVKTPTDTIGQHIHLVKFDVTSSDGSGNGWNYEDGTFAADELSARRCASTAGTVTQVEDAAGITQIAGECTGNSVSEAAKEIWRRPLGENRDRFQTTVQRWFADPILTFNGNDAAPTLRDRTMRTVFTHDHFGPSSIQQHGFYSALVIEPGVNASEVDFADLADLPAGQPKPELDRICTEDGASCVTPLSEDRREGSVAWGGEVWDGTKRKVSLKGKNPAHPDYREFAISIADFALLYDPRDRTSEAELRRTSRLGPNNALDPSDPPYAEQFGMGQIYCEAKWRQSPLILKQLCGVNVEPDNAVSPRSWYMAGETIPPAWIAGGAYRDDVHKARYVGGDLFTNPAAPGREVRDLFAHMVSYRARAAGHLVPPANTSIAALAKPVAPPARPESISVDHHDPYLVSYRNAPLPLRIGNKEQTNPDGPGHSNDCRLLGMGVQGVHFTDAKGNPLLNPDGSHTNPESPVVRALKAAAFGECSIDWQMAGEYGDMGGALMSGLHGDPETPVLEAYQNERLVIRLIQGAQEVQHTFNVAGLAFKRNIDQTYPAGRQLLGMSDDRNNNPSLRERCMRAGIGLRGRPDDYVQWRDDEPDHAGHGSDWEEYETALAGCDNLEGLTFAQEIGISEHFEMTGSLRADLPHSAEWAQPEADAATTNSDEDISIAQDSSDYLYNFGSVDALWNGAWGLLRIYGNQDTPDPATLASLNTRNTSADPAKLSPAGTQIFDRLGSMPFGAARETSVEGEEQVLPMGTGGLSCPYLPEGQTSENGPKQRVIEAVLAAVETDDIWPIGDGRPGGTDYGRGRYDPDGLMLALLSPTVLVEDGLDGGNWDTLTRTTLNKAISDAYPHGPRPMTLRVQAGDCVRLRFVNALKDSNDGLRDELGDARLPPITPLNTDPVPTKPESGKRIGALEPASGPLGGLRPSAQLGLSVALPGMDMNRDLPLAYGYGAPALPAAEGDAVGVSNPFMFYAGRMRVNLGAGVTTPNLNEQDLLNLLIADIVKSIADELAAGPQPWLTDGTSNVPAPGETGFLTHQALDRDDGPGVFSLLGVEYGIAVQPQDLTGALAQSLSVMNPPIIDASAESMAGLTSLACTGQANCAFNAAAAHQRLMEVAGPIARAKLNEKVHWIPYAFGAVPIRSTSDVIGHAPHGLFGAIDVVPSSWGGGADDVPISAPQAAECEERGPYNYCQVTHAENAPDGAGDGSPALYTAEPLDDAPEGTEAEQVREFVLYYQDGLNLWDNNSNITWKWDTNDDGVGDGSEVEGIRGLPLKMVPECIHCDDSYDLGDLGVSYRSPAFVQGLSFGGQSVENSDDLNALKFPARFWVDHPNAIRLKACAGEQVVIRVIHPGGRARQRAFVMNGADYDDLFPGFGFPRSALVAPGKTISAWLSPRIKAGTYLWHDGPTTTRAGGTWGLLEVAAKDQCAYPF
ncbi:cupredoxin domain-containing protein [Paracoccus xiamenensis]|uniref:hypothetical protein n=1 Tax=Paracoccus xiamenensis TaxID=2714901 RepID=UPI001409855D|nr:hypothetical protein [Paracoccus xiamenensis]NHF72003.1 hypothetical protein [Paracoccus xiamenensis]